MSLKNNKTSLSFSSRSLKTRKNSGLRASKIRLMFVLGTRPEAIKLAPVILEAEKRSARFETAVIVTAQHRQMLDDVLTSFHITPDADLNIMAPGQSLFHVTSKIVAEMEPILKQFAPDIVISQGDTTTTFAAALCGFYAGKKIAHIEAGLRTRNKYQPFPEEINRRMTSVLADYHFCPTESARWNLIEEGYDEANIFVTGNTVIDALMYMLRQIKDAPPEFFSDFPSFPSSNILSFPSSGLETHKIVLITGHRRESFGAPFKRICNAFAQLAKSFPDVAFVYPVHLNPNVQQPVNEILGRFPNFFLLSPQPYPAFCWLMQKSYLIITDSGGIQEEAPALGKPVLVTRQVTERPEAVQEGMVKLVGDDAEKIIHYTSRLLHDKEFYTSMAKGFSPYGDGTASGQILDVLENEK